jgi:hypothetical protein
MAYFMFLTSRNMEMTARMAVVVLVFVFHESNFVLFIPAANRLPRGWWRISGHRWMTAIEGFKRFHHA